MSPLDDLAQQRADRRRMVLAAPSRTAADVSHALGVRRTSSFLDVFKDLVATTPTQYQVKAE